MFKLNLSKKIILVLSLLTLIVLSSTKNTSATTKPHLLYFGYYYAANNIDKVKDHSNVIFARSMDDVMKIMTTSNLKVVYDMTWELWSPVSNGSARWEPLGNWQAIWTSQWQQLKPYANRIAAIYPIDEPDMNSNRLKFEYISDTIKATTNTDKFNIPILAVYTPQAIWAMTDYKKAVNGPDFNVNSTWIVNGKFTTSGDHIDWVGVSEYGCWDKNCAGNINLNKKFDTLVNTFSKSSRLKQLVVLADGYMYGNKIPSTSSQNNLVKINQNIYKYCRDKSSCIAELPFLYESDFSTNLVGLNSMPIVATDLQKTADTILKTLK